MYLTKYFLKVAVVILGASLLTSCASSSISSLVKSKSDRPYASLLVVTTTGESFKGFNEENFNNYVRNNFNDFANIKYRKQLEKSLARNIGHKGYPTVFKASELFLPDEDYTYGQFIEKMKQSGCEAILFVNLDNYWVSSDYVTTHYENISITKKRQEPNSKYLVTLYDVNELKKYKWIGEVVVEGIYAGYDTLNNYLARKVTRHLQKEKFLIQ